MCSTGELATLASVMATSESTESLARRLTRIGVENRQNSKFFLLEGVATLCGVLAPSTSTRGCSRGRHWSHVKRPI